MDFFFYIAPLGSSLAFHSARSHGARSHTILLYCIVINLTTSRRDCASGYKYSMDRLFVMYRSASQEHGHDGFVSPTLRDVRYRTRDPALW